MSTLAECIAQVPEDASANKAPNILAFYEELLTALGADEPLNILEVGVLRGGHILALLRRLPKARIVGIDVTDPPAAFWDDVKSLGAEGRVQIRLGSQTDTDFVHRVVRDGFGGQKLDFVTDDALHTYWGARPTFETVFMDWVREGGVYCIEDWGAGYFIISEEGQPDGRRGLPKLVKQLVDQTAVPDRTVAWKGERSIPDAPGIGKLEAPISRAVIVNSVAAFYRGTGDWMPALDSRPLLDSRVVKRDAIHAAKKIAKRALR